MLEILFNWFILHSALIIELLGVLFALVYLWFSIRQKIWLWPFGILTSAFYIYVFYHSRLYADMGLQVYYLVVSIYGWYNWLYGGKKGKKDTLPVRAVNRRITGILLSVTFVVYWVLVWMLTFIPHWLAIPSSQLIYWDAFTTAASIVATWMLTQKILEQWLVWIAVDAVSMGLYIYKGLYLTAGLFLVYATMAVIGYLQWRQGMNAESIPSEETKI
ncbi:MAG: nicotinamide mononucleotide transporter [Bacteroidales bacterium]|nr:nicotinamide mononucleotide transporter [Bacteroidales bacterium]